MTSIDFTVLAQQCAPQVAPATLAAIVKTESEFNPYAIGVVHGQLIRQPHDLGEAIATAKFLERQGWNYSVGLAQVNHSNFARYGLTPNNAFDPCLNVATGAEILRRCYQAARQKTNQAQEALKASLSCYTSGDFVTGYRIGYVQRVMANATAQPIPTVPAIEPRIDPIPVVRLDRTGKPAERPVRTDGNGKAGSDGAEVEQESRLPDDSAVVF